MTEAERASKEKGKKEKEKIKKGTKRQERGEKLRDIAEEQERQVAKYKALNYQKEPWLNEHLKIFGINNSNLIKSTNHQFIDQSQELINRGLMRGERHEDIAKKLFSQQKRGLEEDSIFKKARTRAAVIARDQVNKANGDMTRLRQEKAEVKKFIWRTAGDSRVRAEHRAFDGKTYTWKKGAGPRGIFPGEDIMCRCYAEPVIDE